MTDLGLYNFVQKELASGKSKDQITSQLSSSGHSSETIEELFRSVENGAVPTVTTAAKKFSPRIFPAGARPPLITFFCVLLGIIIALDILLFFGAFTFLGALFGAGAKTTGGGILLLGGFGLLFVVTELFPIAVLYGYWNMRRWAVYLHGILLLINVSSNFTAFIHNPISLHTLLWAVSVITFGVGFSYLNEMT